MDKEFIIVECAWCKKVKLHGIYQTIPSNYYQQFTEYKKSHGICDECVKKLVHNDKYKQGELKNE
jgi:hypothetical protein